MYSSAEKEVEVKKKIAKLLSYSPDIEFIGWKNDKWLGSSKTVAIFYCKKHKINFELNCSSIMKSRTKDDGSIKLSCNLCKSETMNIIPVDKTTFDNIIKEFFDRNSHLKLLSIDYNGFSDSLVKFTCTKHNNEVIVFYQSIE